jgi:hypothetical protein
MTPQLPPDQQSQTGLGANAGAFSGRGNLSDFDTTPSSAQQPPAGKGQLSLLDIEPYPKGAAKPATLPEVTNEDLKRWGRTALDYLPAVGATLGSIAAPEFALPAEAGWLATTGTAAAGAALGGASGEAERQAALAAIRDQQGPQGVGDAVGRVAKTGLEQGAADLGGRLISAPFEWALGKVLNPENLYQSALKPRAGNPAEQAATVSAGLEGIPGPVPAGPLVPGESALETNRLRRAQVDKGITDVLRNSRPQSPYLIDPMDVASRLDDLAANSSKGQQALNADDLNFIKQAKREYLTKHGAQFDSAGNMTRKPTMMTGPSAQAEKVATYKEVDSYGHPGDVRDESNKALAYGLKEGIAGLYPEVSDLNAQDTAMIRLDNALKSYVSRQGNRTPVSMKQAAGAALSLGGGVATGHPLAGIGGAMAVAGLHALDDPAVKSALAIALYTRAAKTAMRAGQEALPTAGKFLLNDVNNQQPQN